MGRRGLLLEDAYVYTVIGNPLDIENATSYKYAAPGHALGTLSDDAPNGVVGHLGTLPDTAALTVNATDVDNGTQRTVSAQAVDEASVGFPTGSSPLLQVAELGLLQQATTIIGGTPARESGDMCVRVVLAADDTPLRFCNRYVVQGLGDSGDELGPLAPLAADDLDTGLGLISTAQYADPVVRSVDVSLKLGRGLAFGDIQSARATRSRVRRGGRLGVVLTVRILRGPLRKVSFSVPVSRSLKPGRHELHLTGTGLDDPSAGASEIALDVASGGDQPSEDTGADPGAGPVSAEDLKEQFDGIARYDGIAGRVHGRRRAVPRLPRPEAADRRRRLDRVQSRWSLVVSRLGSADQLFEQLVQGPRRVLGQARVGLARLDDRARRRDQPAEAVRRRHGGDPAGVGVAGGDADERLEVGPDLLGRKVRGQRHQAVLVERDLRAQEVLLTAEDHDAGVDALAPLDVGDDAHDRVGERATSRFGHVPPPRRSRSRPVV